MRLMYINKPQLPLLTQVKRHLGKMQRNLPSAHCTGELRAHLLNRSILNISFRIIVVSSIGKIYFVTRQFQVNTSKLHRDEFMPFLTALGERMAQYLSIPKLKTTLSKGSLLVTFYQLQ